MENNDYLMVKKDLRTFYDEAKYETSDKDWRVSIVPPLVIGNGRILDLGCNNGVIASKLKMEQNEVVGVELALDLCKKAQRNGIEVVCADAEYLPFRECVFDCATLTEILEHLISPEKTVEEVYRLLKKSGELVVTVPNLNSLFNRIAILLGRMGGLGNPEHLRNFNTNKICGMLNLSGFKTILKKSSPATIPLLRHMIQIPFLSLGDSIIIKAVKVEE